MPRIDIPLSAEDKQAFADYCDELGSTPTVELRRWIKARCNGVAIRVPVSLQTWERCQNVAAMNGATAEELLAQTIRKIAARAI